MSDDKTIRVYVDGCFDMLHFGHANALRQAKQLGDVLVVGVHSDEEITLNKGPPLFYENERYKIVSCLKMVDEIVHGASYNQLSVIEKYNCDFCAHGSDTTIDANGQDAYYNLKKANKYKEFQRTPSISTTDIIQRILNLETKSKEEKINPNTFEDIYPLNLLDIFHFQSQFKDPLPSDTVVYVPGSFDLMHVGHVMLLEECAKLGTYIIIGLYFDDVVRHLKGDNYPIMRFSERFLTMLGFKMVSNIVIGAPLHITETFMNHFKIDKVVHGKEAYNETIESYFEVPKSQNKLYLVDSGSSVNSQDIIDRVKRNCSQYEARNKLKKNQGGK